MCVWVWVGVSGYVCVCEWVCVGVCVCVCVGVCAGVFIVCVYHWLCIYVQVWSCMYIIVQYVYMYISVQYIGMCSCALYYMCTYQSTGFSPSFGGHDCRVFPLNYCSTCGHVCLVYQISEGGGKSVRGEGGGGESVRGGSGGGESGGSGVEV